MPLRVTKETWPPEERPADALWPATVTRNSCTESSGTGSADVNPELPLLFSVPVPFRPERGFWLSLLSTPSSVMLFWSRRAPITSPFWVTPGSRLSNCTTFLVCSGRLEICFSWKALPTEASTVFRTAASAITLTVEVLLATSSATSTVEGVSTSNLMLSTVRAPKPAASTDKE